jgi:hypothetical protein
MDALRHAIKHGTALCECGHVEHAHGTGTAVTNGRETWRTCGGADIAANRNWCGCTTYRPRPAAEVIEAHAQRYSSYWFVSLDQARDRVKRYLPAESAV